MKKKVLLVMLAFAVVFGATGCSVTVNVETEKETEKKTEKETEKKTEKETETETESEITLDTTVLDGTVTDWSDTEITINDKDEKASYTINIADADWKLDKNGLYDGITVSVTLESATSKNGIFYAKELTELDDPAEDTEASGGSGSSGSGSSGSGSSGSGSSGSGSSQTEAQTQAQTQAQTAAQTEAQTQAPTSAPADDGTMYVEGIVTYADGAVITVDDYNGESWTFDIAGASTELDANGLYEGITVGVTASDSANSDGSYTADDVSEIDDPIEDDSENTMND